MNPRKLILAASVMLLWAVPALAMLALPRPDPFPDFTPGDSAPFAGAWAVSIPTMDPEIPDRVLARCRLPVTIRPADPSHIVYLAPRQTEPDPAMELKAQDGGAVWLPIAGGPSFFAFWVGRDMFYLYDAVPQAEADWGLPYVYRRCP